MPILKSPGCNCSCGCLVIERPNYNTAVAANTEHEIAHSIPVNCTVDLCSLFDPDYFADSSNQFQVKIKNTSGTTTHKTFTFQSYRETASSYDPNTSEYASVPILKDTLAGPYKKKGYKRWINIGISGETDDYKAQETMRVLSVGDLLYRIKSVSAGTFERSQGLAVSYLAQYQQIANEGNNICELGNIGAPTKFVFDKDRYVFEDSETSQTFKVYRAHRNNNYPEDPATGQETEVKTNVLFRKNFAGDKVTTTWASGQTSETYTFNESLVAGSFYDLLLSVDTSTRFFRENIYEGKVYIESNSEMSSVKVIPTASEQGDGHFELETTKVNGFQGQATDVRVFRTGGNSTAVTVVVAVGNSDVTLNFAAGEVIKSFTINHDTHDGETFTAGMAPTNDYLIPQRFFTGTWQNPLEFVLRKNTFEFGHIDQGQQGFYIRKVGGHELWQDKIPFERTGWTNSSVKFFVESNSAIELEAYKIYEITHDPTCQVAGDNVDCTPHNRCGIISEYHTQQFDIDLDIGLDASYFPPVSYYLNDECSTLNVYWNPFLDTESEKGKWIYQESSHIINYVSTETTVINYDGFFSDSSFTYEADCGDVTETTTHSMSGCMAFDTTASCYTVNCAGDQYSDIIVTRTVHPVTEEQTFDTDPIASGSTDDACHTINTCDTVDLDTTSGLQRAAVSATAIKAERYFDTTGGYRTYNHSEIEALCSNNSRTPHLKHDRFIVDDRGTGHAEVEHLTVWEWNGFANLDTTGPHSNIEVQYTNDCTSTYIGQEQVYVYDATTLVQLGGTPKTPSQIATDVSSILTSGGADYWFEYTNPSNTSQNGYYRVVYPNTLSGPFSTADDGSGNVFYNIFEEIGVKLELSLDYYTSEFSGDYDATNWDSYLATLYGYWFHDPLSSSFAGTPVIDVTEQTANKVQTLDITVPFTNSFKSLDSTCLGEDGPLNSNGIFMRGFVASTYHAFKNYSTGGSVTQVIDGVFQNEDYDCSGAYCNAAAAEITSACIATGSELEQKLQDDSKCYKIGDPAYTTGTCTSTTNYLDVCCDEAVAVEEIVDTSYYDFSSNQDWNGELEQTAQECKWFQYELTLGTIPPDSYTDSLGQQLYPSEPGSYFLQGKGPADYIFQTAKYFFPVKYGTCWTGVDARSENWTDSSDEIVGPEKIYALRSMTSGLLPAHTSSGPTEGGTAYELTIDFEIQSNVIERSDFNITAEAYSPLWQKL